MVFSIYKKDTEKWYKAHYCLTLLVVVASFVLIWLFPKTMHGLKDNAVGIVFALLIVLITMKVEFRSKPLQWLGERLFPLYIYQRIPMLVLSEIDEGQFVQEHLYSYITLCGVATLAFGYTYKYWQIKLA